MLLLEYLLAAIGMYGLPHLVGKTRSPWRRLGNASPFACSRMK
jgi:hypothetical protein